MLSFLVFGCSNIGNSTGEDITPTVRLGQILLSPSPLRAPTATLKPANTSPAMLLTKQCLKVAPSHEWDGVLTGTLVLASPTTIGKDYFLDMRTGTKRPFSNEEYLADNFSVSPNGNWLAYIGGNKSSTTDLLIVQSADGQEQFTYPVNYQEWQSIGYWLDDKTLILWHHASPLDNIILFNPFTGHKDVMGLEYPDILPEDGYGWDQFWPSITIYDPSLQHLVYLATGKDGYKPGNAMLVLWDRKAAHQITKINNLGLTSVYPLWKSNGSGLVYVKSETGVNPHVGADELFFLGLDGKSQQLTKFADYFQKATIYSYSWSPDERSIALNLETNSLEEQGQERHLLVLNTSSLEIIDYCLAPEQFTPLIWSTDSQHLAFSEYLSDQASQTVVIDLINQEAFVVAENLELAGWLQSVK